MLQRSYKIVTVLCLVVLSLPGYSQHFYDSAGHVLAYQKGVVLYNSLNKPIGHISPEGFKDTAGFEIITRLGNGFGYSNLINRFKYRDSTLYTGVYEDGSYIFDLPNRHNIGQIIQYDIYDADGVKIGRIDKAVPEAEAILFYFMLVPIYGGTQ